MARKPDPERRARFLEAALKLFAANGVQNTSTAAIAREAGSAAGTLFIYFPTKQDLINELVLVIGQRQSEHLRSIVTPDLPVRDAFWIIWEGSIRWLLTNMDAYLYIQQIRDSGLIADSVIRQTETLYIYYYETIQRGFENGQIKRYPIDLIGGFLYHDIVAMVNLIRSTSDPVDRADYIRIGFDIFWDGIRVHQS